MNIVHRVLANIKANFHAISVGSVLLLHGLFLGWIATVNAPTFDEIAHLPSGLSHWQFGNYDLYQVNPPLMRMIAAVPLLVINPQTEWMARYDDPFARPEFQVGSRFLELNSDDIFWYFTICRWALIPVSVFGGWICYCWARELFGMSSGLVALLLWCFCPNVLAWGASITPDLGAAAFGTAAGYAFWRWLKAPTWRAALTAGAALGLAELSKSTWIALFVLWPAIWIYWRYSVRSLQVPRPPVRHLAGILFLALYLLNLGYCFDGTFQQLGQFKFISHTLGGSDAHKSSGNRFRGTLLGSVPVPLPANYIKGLDVQKYDFEVGKWSYLRGEHKRGGWYHYYLYALAVKTPLGTLFLLGLSTLLAIMRRECTTNIHDELVLLLPAIMILVLVSSQTGFNRYLRYVLPAIPFCYIFASRIGKTFESRHQISKVFCGIALATSILSSLSTCPHVMSYFNLMAGGPYEGPAHLLDANVDWGQDLLELKRFVDRHPEASPIGLAYFGFADPKLAKFAFTPIALSASPSLTDRIRSIIPGWYAVSVNHLYGYRHFDSDTDRYTHFQRFTPKATAGYSIYIFHITCEDIANAVQSQAASE